MSHIVAILRGIIYTEDGNWMFAEMLDNFQYFKWLIPKSQSFTYM